MKFTHLSLLSIGTLIMLNGCHERGTIVPPSHPDYKKQKKTYRFPVLKLSAKTETLEPVAKIQKKEVSLFDLSSWVKPDQKKNVKKETKIQKPTLSTEDTPKKRYKSTEKKEKILKDIPILGGLFSGNFSIQDIPIVNKILPKPSEKSKNRVKHLRKKTKSLPKRYPQRKEKISSNTQAFSAVSSSQKSPSTGTNFSGGTSVSNLDIAKIRIETDKYQTNLILDSYVWNGYNRTPSEEAKYSGIYFFKYQPYSHQIIGHIKGYKGFSALVRKENEMIRDNPMIKDIYIDRYVGKDGIKFIIELKENAKVNVIDIEEPASIIIELYPLKK